MQLGLKTEGKHTHESRPVACSLSTDCKFSYNVDGVLSVQMTISRLSDNGTDPPILREHIDDDTMAVRLQLGLKTWGKYIQESRAGDNSLITDCMFTSMLNGMMCAQNTVSRLSYNDTGPRRLREHIDDDTMAVKLQLGLKTVGKYIQVYRLVDMPSTLTACSHTSLRSVVCSNDNFSTQLPRYWPTHTQRTYGRRYYGCLNAARPQK
jgi:hypothetical protein